jgi:uncharacterized phage protein (TIGR01671 family)
MREILFRGKRKVNGEWVHGFLFVSRKGEYKIKWYDPEYGSAKTSEVYPETVGQYTGLTDKNGKKIFEGDMIKPFDDEIDKMVVEFHYGQFLLCLYGDRGYMAEYGWEESGNYGCFEAEPLSSYGKDIEVIGNIHDHPELLGGADNG